MFRKLGTIWCSLRHDSLTWPIHGQSECRKCGRRYPAFAEAPIAGRSQEVASPGASQLPASVLAATSWLSRS